MLADSMGTGITSSLKNLSSAERSLFDTSTSGTIAGKQPLVTPLTRGASETVTYYCGMAGYKNLSFTVQENFPASGILRFVVPAIYDQNGDNSYRNDDYVELEYTLSTKEEEDKPIPPASYGDMNLGQREHRRLHYKKTVLENNPDAPIYKTDPVTGEQTETGEFEKMAVDYEYVTEYGSWASYASSPEGEEAGAWNGVPEATGDIYPIDDVSWWEYDQEWPDQSDDAYYKIWLVKNDDTWSPNDEDYYRSETTDHPFTLGFSTSRSRATTETSVTPNLKVSVYGISPDTDDEGELIETFRVTSAPIAPYKYDSTNYSYLTNQYIADRYSSESSNNSDYPKIRVRAEIDSAYHGESGIYGDTQASPYHNGWQDAHDSYDRVFEAKSDDMELTDVKIKDSEGIVVYHAKRDGGSWQTKVKGFFDKEEDYTMSVKLKQTRSSGHLVKNPTIDVQIDGENSTGGTVSTYVSASPSHEGEELGLDVETTFDNIAFRPKNVSAVNFSIRINNIHGSDNWRENIWDADEDSYQDKIQCTTANLKVSPNIEIYNSKYNQQNYLSFAEKLNFKFDIQHIGEGERQTSIVGNSSINPLAKLDVYIYNADSLSHDEYGNLKYNNVRRDDPKATQALIWTGAAEAKSRLYPGLGAMNYSTHVQAWINNYVVQSYKTLSGNTAAYGRVLVAAEINNQMFLYGTNENTSPLEDYVQQEMIGEHNLNIADMVITGQNSISNNSWYYGSANKDKETGSLNQPNKNGISVSVAISNTPSSYADATIIDRTYLDIFIGDEETPRKTMIVDIPEGDTVPVEVVIPDILIEKNLKVTAKVNYGTHQTHYEYVLPSTNFQLNKDPFTDNVAVKTVSPNLPDKEHSPNAEIIDGIPPAVEFK